MANTKAAQKALRSSAAKNKVNNSRRNRIRTFARKVADAIKAGDQKVALESLRAFEAEIMRGVTKKVVKLNTAARKVSKLSSQVKALKK